MSNFTRKRRRNRRNACGTGKVRFRDKKEAVTTIQYFQSNDGFNAIPRRAYRCRECDGWHLTSQEASSKAAMDACAPSGRFEKYLSKRVKEFFGEAILQNPSWISRSEGFG